jgi:hypothetical protein
LVWRRIESGTSLSSISQEDITSFQIDLQCSLPAIYLPYWLCRVSVISLSSCFHVFILVGSIQNRKPIGYLFPGSCYVFISRFKTRWSLYHINCHKAKYHFKAMHNVLHCISKRHRLHFYVNASFSSIAHILHSMQPKS